MKIKLLILISLLSMSCATAPRIIMINDIFPTCRPFSKISVSKELIQKSNATDIFLSRYKKCYGYKDLLIVTWHGPDNLNPNPVVSSMLPIYLEKINKKARAIQYEYWQNAFYILFVLE